MARPLVSDELWGLIEPLIPKVPRRQRFPGRKRLDDRKVLTGILFVLQTGMPWEYLPQEMGCGSGMTCWRRLREWQEAGVWQRLDELVVRSEQILTPAEAEPVREGDYVYLLAPPEKAQALDRFFVKMPPPAAPDPRLLGDFFVPGDATLGALADIYGLQLASDHMDVTLAVFFTEQLRRPAKTGDVVQLGPIALLAHKVENSRVTTVGLRLAEPEEAADLVGRLKLMWKRIQNWIS